MSPPTQPFVESAPLSADAPRELPSEGSHAIQRLHGVISKIAAAISILDREGRILYESETKREMFGAAESRQGHNCFEFIHPDDQAEIYERFSWVVAHPGRFVRVRLRWARGEPDQWAWIESSATNALDDPEICGVLVSSIDLTERLAAEAAVRRSAERFRALVQNSSDVITIASPAGVILYSSESARRVFGYAPEENIGTKLADLVHPDDFANAEKSYRAAVNGSAEITQVCRVRCADGSYKWLETVAANRTADPLVAGIVLNSRDITIRHRMEESIRERDAFLSARFEVQRSLLRGESVRSQMTGILKILGTTARCSRALFFEATATGGEHSNMILTAEWCAPGVPSRFVPGAVSTRSIGNVAWYEKLDNGDLLSVRRGQLTGEQGAIMDRVGIKASVQAPIRVQGRLVAVIGYQHLYEEVEWTRAEEDHLRDVAAALTFALQRESTTEALLAEKARLAVMLESLSEGVIATDAEGRITLANPVAEQILGWREQELRGCDLTRFFEIRAPLAGDPSSLPSSRLEPDAVGFVLAHGKTISSPRHICALQRGGGRVHVASSTSPLRNGAGGIVGVVRVFRDITEEEHIQSELVRIGKLDGLGAIAAGIAHDFNNILTALNGNVSLALLDLHRDDRAAAEARLAEAETAGQRARELTAQMLTFTKGGVPIRGVAQLEEIIRESISFALHGSSTRSEMRLQENLPPIEADGGQIHQVIHNLALNAVQAMDCGGVLTLAARQVTLAEDNGTPALSPGAYVEISLADTGPGIAPDILPKIFDPFFTTKPSGSGLGLATAYAIVKNHRGRITCEANPGGGTLFRVWLPAVLAALDASTTPRPMAPALGAATAGFRVLVLDDDDDVRALTTRMLTRLGYGVEKAATAEEALSQLRAARSAGQPFHLALLDLTIPGGPGGFEVMRIMREEDPALHSVACSGYIVDDIRTEYVAQGFSAILAKPFRVPELAATLETVLRSKNAG